MKKLFKYSVVTSFSILLCLFLVSSADAQHGGGGHSGGGGGGHFSGGGGGGAHFSGGGGGARVSPGGGGARVSGGSARGNLRSSGTAIRGGSAPRVGIARPGAAGIRGNSRGIGVNGARGFRGNGPGIYGHGGQFGHYGWGRHGGFFFNGGFYGSLYFPWLGFSCWYLPYGYYPFYWDNYPYYFSDGFYYQYNDNQYTVVEPPVGAVIKTLPSDAKSIVINGQQYYELNGVYYLPMTGQNGEVQYQIAGKDGQLTTEANGAVSVVPKIGDIVTKLPADCRKVKLNGETLFVSEDGIYYQETKDKDNNTVYKIVGLETESKDN